jgi:alcohol dehydrogenase class IV
MINGFDALIPVEVKFGRGEIKVTGEVAKRYGQKTLIVCGKNSSKVNGTLDKLTESLKSSQIEYSLFDKVENEPTVSFLEEGINFGKEFQPNCVIGLGSGSAIDSAKAIAVGIIHTEPIWHYVRASGKNVHPTDKTLPIIAIPTTSGSGAQMTPYSVIVNPEQKLKASIISLYIYPKVAICDPELTFTMPVELLARSGFIVFSHAVSAYLSRRSNVMSDVFAKESIRNIFWNLERAYTDISDLEAREGLVWADIMGGMAISLVGAGIQHILANNLSALFGINYSSGLPIVSIGVFRLLKEEKIQRIKELASMLTIDTSEMRWSEVADKYITTIDKMIFNLNLKSKLSDFNVNQEYFKDIAVRTAGQMQSIIGRKVTEQDVEKIFNILKEAL